MTVLRDTSLEANCILMVLISVMMDGQVSHVIKSYAKTIAMIKECVIMVHVSV